MFLRTPTPGAGLPHRFVVFPAHRGLREDHVVCHREIQAAGGDLHGQQHPEAAAWIGGFPQKKSWGIHVDPIYLYVIPCARMINKD